MRLAQKWSWKADLVGFILCAGLITVMDVLIMTKTSDNGRALLLMTIIGAAAGAAVSRWQGPMLRRWACVAAGTFLAQASLVLLVVLITVALHLLFAHMYIPW
ncbi:hypothetical protein [Streptacidiphilus fuscans]|uniref:Uncharacterized protein n=1 Tax=Streptacidiphilus fuscans TaxID=2789292 RepID=A0A931FEL3_9ACTN|nr:hypothetical protein [Streptacidiphilus fuscans]MBF9070728.1 hypothetical protein [Streptacidiphilus fuscans]